LKSLKILAFKFACFALFHYFISSLSTKLKQVEASSYLFLIGNCESVVVCGVFSAIVLVCIALKTKVKSEEPLVTGDAWLMLKLKTERRCAI
jgi:hypothetical protein